MNLPAQITGHSASLPATYEAARTALSECARIDECQGWADKAAALASYAKQADDKQLENMAMLDGFEHLQTGYTVERDGERVLVPIDVLSDEELASRAAEYDAMAEGCKLHAKEIRAYIRSRDGERAA